MCFFRIANVTSGQLHIEILLYYYYETVFMQHTNCHILHRHTCEHKHIQTNILPLNTKQSANQFIQLNTLPTAISSVPNILNTRRLEVSFQPSPQSNTHSAAGLRSTPASLRSHSPQLTSPPRARPSPSSFILKTLSSFPLNVSSTTTSSIAKAKRNTQEVKEIRDECVRALTRKLNQRKEKKDDAHCFAAFVETNLRSFPPLVRKFAMRDIHEILFKYGAKHRQQEAVKHLVDTE